MLSFDNIYFNINKLKAVSSTIKSFASSIEFNI